MPRARTSSWTPPLRLLTALQRVLLQLSGLWSVRSGAPLKNLAGRDLCWFTRIDCEEAKHESQQRLQELTTSKAAWA